MSRIVPLAIAAVLLVVGGSCGSPKARSAEARTPPGWNDNYTPVPTTTTTTTVSVAPAVTAAVPPQAVAAGASPLNTTVASRPSATPAALVALPPTTLPPTFHTFGGDVFIQSYVDKLHGATCGGVGRFVDFQVGQVVTVMDGAGSTVAQGTLTGCRWENVQGLFNSPFGEPDYDIGEPLLAINVPNVPELPVYQVRIGWKLWQPISLAQMQSWNWALVLNVK